MLLTKIFSRLRARCIFNSSNHCLLIYRFGTISANLCNPAATSTRTITRVIRLRANGTRVIRRIMNARQTFRLTFKERSSLPICPLRRVTNKCHRFARTCNVFLRLCVTRIRTFVRFRRCIFALRTSRKSKGTMVTYLSFERNRLTLYVQNCSNRRDEICNPW